MYLKRLELRGFKTFADRTELLFGPGLTAIVGPNGAGKSNLFDAIRWVLGETSWRALRTHRTEDVIFAGNGTRRPHGLAQVDLTVDNESGTLPLPFSEVTITRRATRAGESEFFINRVPCRLRDIHMAFLGVGGRGYAMIGQGEVDSLLTASPAERRAVLEEAAGLSHPKRRRLEAERRLVQAAVHLERAVDLLSELEAQAEALAHQAEAAQRYREIEGALRQTELLLHVEAARRLETQLRRAISSEELARARCEAARDRFVSAERELGEARARWERDSALLEEAQRDLVRAVEAARSAEARVRLAEERLRACTGRLESLEQELERLLREHRAGSETLGALREEERVCAEEVARLVEACRSSEERLKAAGSVVSAYAEEVERLRADVFELEHARAQTTNQLAAVRTQLGALRARIEQVARQREAREARIEDLRARLVRRGTDLDALAARISALREERDRTAAELELLRAEEHEVAVACEVHRAQLEEARSRRAGSGGVPELLLLRAEEPALAGVRGMLGEFLGINPEDRAAVEAALGGTLFALLVGSLKDALAARAWLRERGRGGRFLVPELTCPPEEREAPDGAVPACHLVRCDPAVAPFVRALLADTWVVADLDAAVALRDRGFTGRLVTREGDLLEPAGTLHVGGGRPFTRERELNSLRAALEAATNRRAELRRRADDLIAHLERLERELEGALTSRTALEAELAALRRELGLLEEGRDLAAELDDPDPEIRRLSDLEERLRADLGALEDDLRRVRAELESARQRAAHAEREREEASAELNRLRERLAQASSELARLRGRIAERETAQASLLDRIERVRAERAAVAEESARLAEALRACSPLLTAAREEEEAVRDRIRRLTETREKAGQEVEALRERHDAARAELREHEQTLHRLEVRRAHLEAEWQAACERIGEQFGVRFEDASSRAPDELDRETLLRRLEELRAERTALGAVNLRAVEEHEAVCGRLQALRTQVEDIQQARALLTDLLEHADQLMERRFRTTFEEVTSAFDGYFRRLFGGGEASLLRVVGEDGEEGVEIVARPPGRRVRQLEALSGGERVMVALALVFALLRVRPALFCVFDEIEAALDDENTRRVAELLRELAQRCQVLIITHNKATMEAADTLYGITMEEPGVSRAVSVRMSREAPVEAGR